MATGGSEKGLSDARADWWPGHWQHRLVVLRPKGVGEESRRVIGNDQTSLVVDRAWSSPPQSTDRYEIRGSFDPNWIQQVPRQVHEQTVIRNWVRQRDVCGSSGCRPPAEPLDPYAPGNRRSWPDQMDREKIQALATATTVPALYGFINDAGQARRQPKSATGLTDPYFRASSTIMRLDDPNYRAWKARYLLYKLNDHGFSPGDTACVIVPYKPAWHAYYDEETHGPSPGPCYVEGSRMWSGPIHICRRDLRNRISPAGPFNPTQFGPGVFEAGISAFFLEMIETLEQNGYRNPRIITIDTPKYRGKYWSVLSDAVRNHPAMVGEYGHSIEPALPPRLGRSSSVDPVSPESSTSSPTVPVDREATTPAAPTTPPAAPGGSWSIGSARRSSAPAATPRSESQRDERHRGTAESSARGTQRAGARGASGPTGQAAAPLAPNGRATSSPATSATERSVQYGQGTARRTAVSQGRLPAPANLPDESLGAPADEARDGEVRSRERGRLLLEPTGDSEHEPEQQPGIPPSQEDPCVGEDGEPIAVLDATHAGQHEDSASSRRAAERSQRCREARALELVP
jgi:hypothetical protein